MVSRLLPSLFLLAGHLGLSHCAQHPAFTGNGYIHVLNSTNSTFARADPSRRLGCMSEAGAFTLEDCGVFNRNDDT
jgi:hypothetical protein